MPGKRYSTETRSASVLQGWRVPSGDQPRNRRSLPLGLVLRASVAALNAVDPRVDG